VNTLEKYMPKGVKRCKDCKECDALPQCVMEYNAREYDFEAYAAEDFEEVEDDEPLGDDEDDEDPEDDE